MVSVKITRTEKALAYKSWKQPAVTKIHHHIVRRDVGRAIVENDEVMSKILLKTSSCQNNRRRTDT